MKDTDHPVRHLGVHLATEQSQRRGSCTRQNRQDGPDWHELGGKRPHFGTRFRAQCESWSLQPNQGTRACLAPAYSGYQSNTGSMHVVTKERSRGLVVVPNSPWNVSGSALPFEVKMVRIMQLHVQTCQLFTLPSPTNLFSKICKDCPIPKVTTTKKFETGGSDPTFWRTIRPRSSVWVTPARHGRRVTMFCPRHT